MNLHIVASGRGPDLVLLHGWGANSGVWQAAAAEFARRFRVYCVDLPGHGASGPEMPGTLGDMAEWLAAQWPAPAAVCGWSLGAQLALQWAALPHRVGRLILVAATPCFVQRADWRHGMEIAVLDDFARDLSIDCPAALQRFIALQAYRDTAARAVAHELRRRLEMTPPQPAALADGLQWLKTTDLRARLAAIKSPALILHGDRDVVTPPAAGAWLAQTLPAAKLSIFSGSAHAPFLSQPRAFVEQVLEFCDER